MDKYIYRRDYSAGFQAALPTVSEEDEKAVSLLKSSGFFKIYQKKAEAIPRVISSSGRENFEKLLALCDAFARENGCRVEGETGGYMATITLSGFGLLSFTKKNLSLPERIANMAARAVLYSGRDGSVGLDIYLDYYEYEAVTGDEERQSPFEAAMIEAGLEETFLRRFKNGKGRN